ncbi:DUF1836 domain-containing protein [Bacillus timonensis]|nr:DUF1836 domain-containing protein [Bacillus timonensis]
METFQLTRRILSELLLSLRDCTGPTPHSILQTEWKNRLYSTSQLDTSQTILLPKIFEKLMKMKTEKIGLSINDIAGIGNQVEFSMVTSTAIQNWVKRDIKELIGAPTLGKKYSIDQATILFIVEDLKVILDFDSIRKLLTMIFNNPEDRSDDIIDPLIFYHGYADIFEKLRNKGLTEGKIDEEIESASYQFVESIDGISSFHKDMIKNVLTLALFSVYSSFIQAKAKKQLHSTLLLYWQ